MRNKQTIYRLSIIFAFFLLLVLSGYFLLKSNAGTQVIFRIAAKKLGPDLSYDRVSGQILGDLEISNLKYHSAVIDINIGHIKAKNSLKIILPTFVNQELLVENVTIATHLTRYQKQSKSKNLNLPLRIEANRVMLKNIKFISGKNKAIQLPNLVATLKASSKVVSIFVQQPDNGSFMRFYHNKKIANVDLQVAVQQTLWNLHYAASKKHFLLNGEITDNHHGNIELSGRGDLKKFNMLLNLSGNNMHLNDLWPNYWPGQINFHLDTEHNRQGTHIKLHDLTGHINNQSIQGAGELAFSKKKISTLNFNFVSHDAKMFITESKTIPQQIEWLIQIPEIKNFLPKIRGKIFAGGTIEGVNHKPTIKSEFSAKAIASTNYRIEKGEGHFLLNLKSKQPTSYLQLLISNYVVNKLHMDKFELQGSGSLKQHDINIKANARDLTVAMQIEGKYENPQWLGEINKFSINNNTQRWNLLKTSLLTLDKKSIAIEPLTLIGNQSKISVSGSYPFGRGLKGKLDVQNFDLSLLNFLMGENTKLEGRINLFAKADLQQKKKYLKLNAELKPGTLYYPIFNEIQKKKL